MTGLELFLLYTLGYLLTMGLAFYTEPGFDKGHVIMAAFWPIMLPVMLLILVVIGAMYAHHGENFRTLYELVRSIKEKQ